MENNKNNPSTTPASPPGAATSPQPDTSVTSPPDMAASSPPRTTATTLLPSTAATSPPGAATNQTALARTDKEVINDIMASNWKDYFRALLSNAWNAGQEQKQPLILLLSFLAYFTADTGQITRILHHWSPVPEWWGNRVEKGGMTSQASWLEYLIDRALTLQRIVVNTIRGPIRIVDLSPDLDPQYSLDDIGISNLFCALYQGSLLYCFENSHWFVYSGVKWEASDGKAMELCKAFAIAMEEYSKEVILIDSTYFSEPGDNKALARNPNLKFAIRSKSRRSRETILKDAQTDRRMVVSLSQFDQNPYLFNCLNCTIDLATRTCHDHTPQDMITMVAPVTYDPSIHSQLWEQHVMTVMDGDVEKAQFLQKAFGYALSGTNKYASLIIMYGPKSRNGKSATVDTFCKLMGDYADTADPATFSQKSYTNGSAHSDDLARLEGKRMISVPESDKKMTLSSSLVKRSTGDFKIVARAIFAKQRSFEPQFKLFFHTNHLPRITDLKMFDSSRVKVIPFEHFFGEKDRNPNQIAELTTPENLSGILNWALEGWILLETTGFEPPQSVLDATRQYRQDSDQVGNFMMEHMEEDSNSYVSTRSVFELYCQWCESCKLHPDREQDFKKEMVERGIVVSRPRDKDGKQVTAYMGWRIVV